jgi:Mce-associated membrane protein
MSPRKRRSVTLDADHEGSSPEADANSIEEAEAAALQAETRAAVARARAEELRRQSAKERRRARWRSRVPAILTAVAVGAAAVLIVASLVATGLMLWHHRDVTQERQREAAFSAAARQSVVTMMTIDPAKAKEGVQAIIDNATGKFKKDLQATADTMISSMEQAKVATTVDVRSVAVKSMSSDSAVVLVAATSNVTDPDTTKRPPVTWRISVTLERDGDQFKMSKFEFV